MGYFKKSIKMMKEIQTDSYESAHRDRDGKLVAWCTVVSPIELLKAFDIHLMFPENYSALLTTRDFASAYCDTAEAGGYSSDVCSYARINLGHVRHMDSENDAPFGGLPKPDLVFVSNNTCFTVQKWFGEVAKYFNIPLLFFDFPKNYGEPNKEDISYIIKQFMSSIKVLEGLTKKQFDYDKFQRIMDLSSRATKLWGDFLLKNATQPSPITIFNAFNYMIPAVVARGDESALLFYEMLNEEMDLAIKNGVAAVPEENFRLLFDAVPFWYALRAQSEYFKANKTAMVASPYPKQWALAYQEPTLESLAFSLTSVVTNKNLDNRIKLLVELSDTYHTDGVILVNNKSCKPFSVGIQTMAEELTDKYGIPSVIVDGDQADPRGYSEAQFQVRLQSFLEMLAAKKNN